jgi:hypothetical protein
MDLISRRLFEHHLSAHLDRIKPGLAALLQRKAGYSFTPPGGNGITRRIGRVG